MTVIFIVILSFKRFSCSLIVKNREEKLKMLVLITNILSFFNKYQEKSAEIREKMVNSTDFQAVLPKTVAPPWYKRNHWKYQVVVSKFKISVGPF